MSMKKLKDDQKFLQLLKEMNTIEPEISKLNEKIRDFEDYKDVQDLHFLTFSKILGLCLRKKRIIERIDNRLDVLNISKFSNLRKSFLELSKLNSKQISLVSQMIEAITVESMKVP